ncbi:uncharacterized protein RAG0_10590 [Rhynchosporium agropyri]|uniref:Sacsin/Nov domain-containing protein n=1 Tax=Rhynchosporium agropyri TaxID=914238 RepID=A0A1E1L0F8_9HELO|nr:uncharacterized protein RAG0_10590 [Rhynchosporium agropyri]
MAPQPIGSNAQKQRLTTALTFAEIILQVELSSVNLYRTQMMQKFVLDDRTYPTENLIDPKLAQFQGPALLSFNNAVFKDKDFMSLSQLGDSLKLNDGATTGRFGRGFNSVYNWTDSPSIISRERLLILDPHQDWSDGGPVYGFVEDSQEPEIKNQMGAYQSVMVHLDHPLDGTVIRILLRNASQTLKSDISTLSTTPTEIQEVLRSFSAEFGTYGLLFMRNVTKLAIDSAEMSLTIEMIADGDIQTHKATIIDAAGIRYTHDGISTTTSFMIQHCILNTLGISLRPWSQEQQYIPWVAIAAQLPSSQMNSTQCSLFTVLPLPVRTTQPVHIHALFSLTPDRANLHRMHDQSAQNQDPAKWNEWLLREGASVAWVKLLSALAQLYPLQSAFDQWPRAVDNNRDPLSGAVDQIVAIIQQDHLALWPTEIGYVSAETGLLALGSESPGLKEALRDANVPVTYVPRQLWDHAKKLFGSRLLSSANVCAYLNSKPAVVRGLRDRVKIALLEFLVSAPAVIDYGRLELFPFEDGEFRSLDGVNAFVHRDSAEKDLFSRQPELNLALGPWPTP